MITATSTNAASVVPAELGSPDGARDPNGEGFAVVLAALAAVPVVPLPPAPASAPATDAPAGVVAPTGGFAAAFLAGARTTEAPLSVPAIPSASGSASGAPPARAHDPLSSAVAGATDAAAALDPETLGLRSPTIGSCEGPVVCADPSASALGGSESAAVAPIDRKDPIPFAAGAAAARTISAASSAEAGSARPGEAERPRARTASGDDLSEHGARTLRSLARGAEARVSPEAPERTAPAEFGSSLSEGPIVNRTSDSSPSAPQGAGPRTSTAGEPTIAAEPEEKPSAPAGGSPPLFLDAGGAPTGPDPVESGGARPASASALSAGTAPSLPPPSVQIAQALFTADGGSIERLRLRLHPAELGTVEVVVENERTGRTRAALLVERPETLELLRRDLPTLERLFAQAGVSLEPGGLELDLRGEGRRSDRGEAGEGGGGGAARSGAVVRGGATAAPASLYLVDLRV